MQRKQENLDQLYWDKLAGKTPDQKGTTASIVNGHYSLMMELRLRATMHVDHPEYAASPQIGVQHPLYSDSGWQCGVLAPAGGQYPLKPPGDTRGHQSSVASVTCHAKLVARSVRRAIMQDGLL